MPQPSEAQDATWGATPASSDWSTAANWSSGAVPTGTATFGGSSQTTIGFSPTFATIGTMQFKAGAPAYTFLVHQSVFPTLTFTDKGIVNNSGFAPVFDVGGPSSSNLIFLNSSTAGNAIFNINSTGEVGFRNNSSAGSATINNSRSLSFTDSGSAGSAKITNSDHVEFVASSSAEHATIINNSARSNTTFSQNSTAGSATIINSQGIVAFNDSSTAGVAIITNNSANSDIVFTGNSTAGNATITNTERGGSAFNDSSTAGNATIANSAGSSTVFIGSSTAGNATVINNAGGSTFFVENSTGGNARFITNAGGVFDMSGLFSAGMTAGSIEGAGSYLLGGKTLTVGSNNRSTEVSGVISDGPGDTPGLVKVGAGTLTLSGANTYAGATAINGGTLAVNGSIASSAVTVNAGGTLAGIGTVGATTVTSGGTVSPGNGSIGTLNVVSSVHFARGSFYAVDTNAAGQSDRIAANGEVVLGGAVQVTAASSIALNTPFTILTAKGGVTGQFAAGTGPSTTFVTPRLTYDPNDVFLTFARNDVSFASVGLTRNQIATGAAVDRLGHGSVFNAVLNGSAAQARQAFDQLSGEVHASTAAVMLDETRYVRDAVTDRLRRPYGNGTGPVAAFAPTAPETAYANAAGTGDTPAQGTAPFAIKAAALPAEPAIVAWVQAIGAMGRLNGDGNAATLRRSTDGFLSGIDATFDTRWRAGMAGGYTRSSLHVDDRRSSGGIDSYHLALYGGGQFGAVGLRGGAALTWHDIDVSRSIVFPGFADATKASSSARTAQVFGEAGHHLTIGAAALEPFAALAYVHLDTGRFAETGGAAALSGAGRAFDVAYTTLGTRAGTAFALSSGMQLNLRGTLGWQHAFGDVTPQALVAFRDGGTPFTVAGTPIARDALSMEAGFGIDLTRNASFFVNYSGLVAHNAWDHSATGNFMWKF